MRAIKKVLVHTPWGAFTQTLIEGPVAAKPEHIVGVARRFHRLGKPAVVARRVLLQDGENMLA
jgi:hypothetical protein